MHGADDLLIGIRALEGADWVAARDAFEAALAEGDAAEANDGLGLALWMLGRVPEGIERRERAFAGYVEGRRCDEAARIAVWVSHQNLIAGRTSAARGWLARADRALESMGGCAGHGWVATERARHAETVDDQVAHARRALEFARKAGDDDLEVYALSLIGLGEVSAGRLEPGMQLLEEAMVAASAGRVRNVHTLAEAYCNLIAACTSAGEWERAREWCEHVDEFARTHQTVPLLGACRTIHADMLIATGRWPEAERSLESAIATHASFIPRMGAPTIAMLAELRVHQGRLPEAEKLLAGREEHPSSLRALALLRIAEGRPHVAASLLERGLRAAEGDAVRATQLLAALVDAALACDDLERADAASAELARIADESGMRLAGARSQLTFARILLAAGREADAAEPARQALVAFGALAMPLDAGYARLALAKAVANETPELAADEVRSAMATFRELGASRAVDIAAGLLRELGGATGGRARTTGELTAREEEVLGLLGLGMSNARIAQTLVISEKTAGHHVSRILMKLGVRNRAEAAAHAARSEVGSG